MTAGMDAAGDLATGALLGRAVEPAAGERRIGSDGHGLCLNCGTALIGAHCHACGQSGHVHRTLSSIGHDLLHGAFHFEGKIWRTLPMLVLHPGALTRRYIAGERARFVSPMALFLFFVFLMFATIHAFGGDLPGGTDLTPAAQKASVAKLDGEIAKAQATLAAERAAASQRGHDAADLLAAQSVLRSLQVARGAVANERPFTVTTMITHWPALDRGIAKANDNPGLMLYKLQSSAYKYSWALIPLSTPFVALLFLWRRRFGLYDHAIFVTYSLAFMLLLVTVLSLLLTIHAPGFLFAILLLGAPPVHMFAQLRGAYSLRKRSAAWRTVALLSFAWVVLTAFVVLILLVGLTD